MRGHLQRVVGLLEWHAVLLQVLVPEGAGASNLHRTQIAENGDVVPPTGVGHPRYLTAAAQERNASPILYTPLTVDIDLASISGSLYAVPCLHLCSKSSASLLSLNMVSTELVSKLNISVNE